MANKRRKQSEGGTFGRLAGRGEEAVNRLVDELGRNPRVTEALHKAMSAKGKLDAASRRTLGTVGLAAADELKDLRKQIERMERRLVKLEGGKAPTRTARRSETKKTPSAKRRTTTRTAKTKQGAEAPSPPPGRAIGGGTGRGSTPSGGAAA